MPTPYLQHASRVRAATCADLGEIVVLLDDVVTQTAPDLDELEDLIRAGHLIVLDVAGEVRGLAVIRLERRRGHLELLVVDPALAAEDVDTRLREVASALCVAHGCRSVDVQ